jgi:hypothetical protein
LLLALIHGVCCGVKEGAEVGILNAFASLFHGGDVG